MGRRGKRHARIASVSAPTRNTVSPRFRARSFRFCRQRKSTDAISGNVIVSLEYSSLAICEPAHYTARPSKPAAFGFASLRGLILSESVSSLAKRRGSRRTPARASSARNHRSGIRSSLKPANAFGRVGVLRLRGCFASRSSYCVQDDSPVAASLSSRPSAGEEVDTPSILMLDNTYVACCAAGCSP